MCHHGDKPAHPRMWPPILISQAEHDEMAASVLVTPSATWPSRRQRVGRPAVGPPCTPAG